MSSPHPSFDPSRVQAVSPWWRQRPFRLYLLGQSAIVAGAAGTAASGSMWPLALGASAGLMLTAPLVLSLRKRGR